MIVDGECADCGYPTLRGGGHAPFCGRPFATEVERRRAEAAQRAETLRRYQAERKSAEVLEALRLAGRTA